MRAAVRPLILSISNATPLVPSATALAEDVTGGPRPHAAHADRGGAETGRVDLGDRRSHIESVSDCGPRPTRVFPATTERPGSTFWPEPVHVLRQGKTRVAHPCASKESRESARKGLGAVPESLGRDQKDGRCLNLAHGRLIEGPISLPLRARR